MLILFARPILSMSPTVAPLQLDLIIIIISSHLYEAPINLVTNGPVGLLEQKSLQFAHKLLILDVLIPHKVKVK